jgi:hypothetical protein
MTFLTRSLLAAMCLGGGLVQAQESNAARQAEARAAEVPELAYSGFLGDYSKLRPVIGRKGLLRYVNPAVDFKPYTKVTFDPVEVVLVPNPDYQGVRPDVLKEMTDNVLQAFIRELEPDYQVVSATGPDVLEVRMAITGLQLVKTDATLFDILPVKAALNAGRAVAGKSPRRAELSAEVEVLDAQGRRAAAAVVTRAGDKTLQQGADLTWSDVDAITAYWAKNFRHDLDAARGVQP